RQTADGGGLVAPGDAQAVAAKAPGAVRHEGRIKPELRKIPMIEICPKCGGTAVLLQAREEFEDIPNLGSPNGKMRVPVKVEEFRCQEQSCEHEFEKFVREPSA